MRPVVVDGPDISLPRQASMACEGEEKPSKKLYDIHGPNPSGQFMPTGLPHRVEPARQVRPIAGPSSCSPISAIRAGISGVIRMEPVVIMPGAMPDYPFQPSARKRWLRLSWSRSKSPDGNSGIIYCLTIFCPRNKRGGRVHMFCLGWQSRKRISPVRLPWLVLIPVTPGTMAVYIHAFQAPDLWC